MNNKPYEYMLMVDREKSFSEAAKKLFVSQPSLSQYIQKLENEYGVLFFERLVPLKTTYAGQLYIRHAKEILSSQKRLRDIYKDLKEEVSGQMIIGTGPLNSACFLPRIMAKFSRLYPKVEVIVRELPEAELVLQADKSEFNLLMTTIPIEDIRFESLELADEEILLAAPKAMLTDAMKKSHQKDFQGRAKEAWMDLPKIDFEMCKDMPFIMLDPSTYLQKILQQMCKEAGISVKAVLHCLSVSTAHAMMEEGLGLMLMPSTSYRHFRNPDQAYFRIETTLGKRKLMAYYNKDDYRTKNLQAILDLMSEKKFF